MRSAKRVFKLIAKTDAYRMQKKGGSQGSFEENESKSQGIRKVLAHLERRQKDIARSPADANRKGGVRKNNRGKDKKHNANKKHTCTIELSGLTSVFRCAVRSRSTLTLIWHLEGERARRIGGY